jgi:Lsr2
MAEQKMLVCDLAHEEPALASTTVELPLHGQLRRLDLCAEHDAHLQSLLAQFLSKAGESRRGSLRGRTRAASKRAAGARRRGGQRPNLPAGQEQIRAWAREQGLQVSDRGRLPKSIVEQYGEAHQDAAAE